MIKIYLNIKNDLKGFFLCDECFDVEYFLLLDTHIKKLIMVS